MKIGELARRTEVKASAIRYYEAIGLLEEPNRTGGQRRYSEETIYRLQLISFAGNMGFTLADIKLFLSGLGNETPVGPRWKNLARRKIADVDRTVDQSLRLKSLLQHLLRCRCASLQACVERLSLSQNLKQIKRYNSETKTRMQ